MTAPTTVHAGGILVDCTHPRAAHQHGTYLAFDKDGCRCAPCIRASRRQSKLVAYRTATHTHTYTDATRARDHVRGLLTSLTVGQIEQRSGVDRTAIRVLVGDFPGRPASKRTKKRTEAALLAVTADRVGPEAQGLVDATGTSRRLRALVALGWQQEVLIRTCDAVSRRTMWVLLHHPEQHPLVNVKTRTAVAAVYDALSLRVPPPSRSATRSRNLAYRAGWVPPLAWDDDALDDPTAVPACAPQRRSPGRPPADLDDFLHLVNCGESPILAARQLGVAVESIIRSAGRQSRTDVINATRVAA